MDVPIRPWSVYLTKSMCGWPPVAVSRYSFPIVAVRVVPAPALGSVWVVPEGGCAGFVPIVAVRVVSSCVLAICVLAGCMLASCVLAICMLAGCVLASRGLRAG